MAKQTAKQIERETKAQESLTALREAKSTYLLAKQKYREILKQ